ncbi:MAG: two-component system chemotaxis response regulator CheY [Candidatus Azotimanducaceae bacterium]|jgi:two-component system chemotaxis response regulator CheY
MPHLAIDDLSILLLEPSTTQRKIIVSRLLDAGNSNVEIAMSADEAWEIMMKGTPDLVISSLYIGDVTSSELLIRMRENSELKDTPFMLISSETKWENLDTLKQAGVMAILPKPFDIEDMKMALQTTADYLDPEEFSGGSLDAEQLRILVVDDSATARKHITNLLKKIGMINVSLANDGVEAIEAMRETIFDLVITDYNMPEMDGEKLTSHIRNHSTQSSIPILMVTSENDQARLDSVLKSGVSAICDKPFDVNEIRGLLQRLLA